MTTAFEVNWASSSGAGGYDHAVGHVQILRLHEQTVDIGIVVLALHVADDEPRVRKVGLP